MFAKKTSFEDAFGVTSYKYVDKEISPSVPAMLGCTSVGAESFFVHTMMDFLSRKASDADNAYLEYKGDDEEKRDKLYASSIKNDSIYKAFSSFYDGYAGIQWSEADKVLAMAYNPELVACMGKMDDEKQALYNRVCDYIKRWDESDVWEDARKQAFSDIKRRLNNIRNAYVEGDGFKSLNTKDADRFLSAFNDSLASNKTDVFSKTNTSKKVFVTSLAKWLVWMYTGKKTDEKKKKAKVGFTF